MQFPFFYRPLLSVSVAMSSVEAFSKDDNRKVTTIYVTPQEFNRIVDLCRASRGLVSS